MDLDQIVKTAEKLIRPYEVTRGGKFRLKDFDPADTGGLKSALKPRARELLQEGVAALSHFQERLFAQNRWSVLLVFQAMDAAGKDSAVKHVMSGVNPQGCQVTSFKVPGSEELDHDFLWRCAKALPERGRIGIFNRSYYEETLVVRVHPELLRRQRLPEKLVTRKIWKERFDSIRCFEQHLAHNGTIVIKFFLHVSRREQKRRFLERIDNPAKNWKFNVADLAERAHWDAYMAAYDDAIRRTAAAHAPWYVVPADNKWFTRLVVASAVIKHLAELKLKFPKVDDAQARQLAKARRELLK
jgi:PPK2 family polyphosphate:nucleotide phosphotransferase